jgi:hypothetical protein
LTSASLSIAVSAKGARVSEVSHSTVTSVSQVVDANSTDVVSNCPSAGALTKQQTEFEAVHSLLFGPKYMF